MFHFLSLAFIEKVWFLMTTSSIVPVVHWILELEPHYCFTSRLPEWLSDSIHMLNLMVQERQNTAMEDRLFKNSYEACGSTFGSNQWKSPKHWLPWNSVPASPNTGCLHASFSN